MRRQSVIIEPSVERQVHEGSPLESSWMTKTNVSYIQLPGGSDRILYRAVCEKACIIS